MPRITQTKKILLNPEMRKGFISFCHTVCIFFFLESATFALAGSNDFIREFFCHALAVSFSAIADKPFHAERNFSVSAYFSRNLESSTTDTATANFNGGSYIT